MQNFAKRLAGLTGLPERCGAPDSPVATASSKQPCAPSHVYTDRDGATRGDKRRSAELELGSGAETGGHSDKAARKRESSLAAALLETPLERSADLGRCDSILG